MASSFQARNQLRGPKPVVGANFRIADNPTRIRPASYNYARLRLTASVKLDPHLIVALGAGVAEVWRAEQTEIISSAVALEQPRPSCPDWRMCMITLSSSKCLVLALVAITSVGTSASAQGTAAPVMTRAVDETQAARRIAFVHEEIWVRPGTLALAYPRWIPGEQGRPVLFNNSRL
jgi:hypothetical protein